MGQVDAVNRSKNVVEIEVFYYCDYSSISYGICGVVNATIN